MFEQQFVWKPAAMPGDPPRGRLGRGTLWLALVVAAIGALIGQRGLAHGDPAVRISGDIRADELAVVMLTLDHVSYMGVRSVEFREVGNLDNRRSGADPRAFAEAGYAGPERGIVHMGTLGGSLRALYGSVGSCQIDTCIELMVVHEACHVYLGTELHDAAHAACMARGLEGIPPR
jgi:hypothetical protein